MEQTSGVRRRGLPTTSEWRVAGLLVTVVAVLLSLTLIARDAPYVARHAYNPQDALVRLGQSPDARERSAGVTRGIATLTPLDGAPFGACRIRYRVTKKKQKNTYHLRDTHAGSRVTFDDGLQWTIPVTTPVQFGSWTPDPLPRDPDEAEMMRVLRASDVLSHEGTLITHCLTLQQKVYVHGCPGANQTIVPCQDEAAVVLSPGLSPAPVREALRARLVAAVSGVVFGLLVIILMAASLVRAPREIVPNLAAHARGQPRPRFLHLRVRDWIPLLAGTVCFVALRLNFFGNVPSAWLALGVAILLIAIYAVWGVMRLRDLLAARRVVAGTNAALLRSPATGASAEYTLRVARDAPTFPGPHGDAHAAIRVSITEDPTETDIPGRIPVEDSSGRGILDLRDCVLDVVPEVDHSRMTPKAAEEFLAELGVKAEVIRLKDKKGKTSPVTLSCTTLDPGDPLLVYGNVERLLPSEAAAVADTSYRQMAELPILRATARDVFVYMGEKPLLVRTISCELVLLALLTPLLFAVLIATLVQSALLP